MRVKGFGSRKRNGDSSFENVTTHGDNAMAGLFYLSVLVLGIIVGVFWIALPFLVNATNTRLDKLIGEVRALREAVERKA